MSALTTQSRNPETVLSPVCIEQLLAQTDTLIEMMTGELRRHIFDNTGALGSMRYIPTTSQQIIDMFTRYVSGQSSQPELQAHVRTLAHDGLSPMAAVLLIDKLHDQAASMLEGVGEGVEAVLHHYRQLFLHNYIDARLSEILAEQESYHKSSQILLQERMEQERQLAVALEKEQSLSLKRAVELETVATISVNMAAILDLRELLDTVVKSIDESFDLYHTHIFLYETGKEKLMLAAAAGVAAEQLLTAEDHIDFSISLHQERSLVARAARLRRSVISSDVQADAHFMEHELLPDTRSELAIPMLVGDELLGVLDMHSADVGRFDEEDARILMLLAAQTAVALQNARQYQQRQEALENLNKLQQVMARENWQAFLTDEDRQIRGYMFENEQLQPIARDGVSDSSSTISKTAVFPDADIPVSIPLTVQAETIGYLDVRNPSGEPLTADEHLLLDGLSRQIADALERARLLETTELGRQELDKRAEQLAVINEVAQVVSQQLGEGELFTAVHEQVARAVVTDTFFIAMYDAAHNQFTFPYFYDGEAIHHPSPMAADSELETTQVWQRGEPIYVNYTPEEFWDRETEVQNLLLTGDDNDGQRPSNMAFIPLMAGAKAIGVMSVQNYQFHDFTEEDISLLFGIANHVGLALENLRLFTETERRAERERLINEISQKIQGAQTVQGAMQTAVSELGRALKIKKAVVELN